MRSINILAIQRISPDDRAKIEASDPAIRLIDAGGWFEGEIRESWTDFAASRYLPPGAIGERLADALDEIVPYRREHAAQTRGDAGTEPDPRAAHQVRATAATGQQRSCSGEAVTSSVSSHSKPYKSCISDGLEQRTSIAR
jgi:hypothetical protein